MVQDVFSRVIWTEALNNKWPATVAATFESKILCKTGTVPNPLTGDSGGEVSGEYRERLQTKGIIPRQKGKDDIKAIAALDTARGNLKGASARGSREGGRGLWERECGQGGARCVLQRSAGSGRDRGGYGISSSMVGESWAHLRI